MIDHVSIPVADLEAAGLRYAAILGALGMTRIVTRPATLGFGKKYPEFWLNHRPGLASGPADTGCHIALRAQDEESVRAFFAAGIAQGCVSGGDPGPRQAAQTTYFGAFLLDPDGNKIEAIAFPKAG